MQILIQHTSGSKANRVDHIDVDSVSEITFGRDPGATIQYDLVQDDDVSRVHAKLRVRKENGPTFLLVDNNSTNGTRVNGHRITAETQLFPEDKVELGSGGPSFIFDLQPRPASLIARTRVINNPTLDARTRMAHGATAAAMPPTTAAVAGTTMGARRGIGTQTVMGLLQNERRITSRRWAYVSLAILVLMGLAGGGLYWRMLQDKQQVAARLEETNRRAARLAEDARVQKDMAAQLKQKVGVTPEEIVGDYARSTVQINFHWRLYDKVTGKPVFQKVYTREGRKYLAYIRMRDQELVPWLTTDSDAGKNSQMDASGFGSGFVVSDDGFIITNKHVAAGWQVHYADTSNLSFVIVSPGQKPEWTYYQSIVQAFPQDRNRIQNWIPSDAAALFDANVPVAVGNSSTEGRDDLLEVQFPRGRAITARLVRTSDEVDIALIKIDSPTKLVPVPIADDTPPAMGGAVTVLGYPCTCVDTVRYMTTNEAGDFRQHAEIVPEPTVTTGTVARLSSPLAQRPGESMLGSEGDVYMLNVAADHGNSGGPVFDGNGKVVAVLTYGTSRITVSEAVPISYGRTLLK
jgi:serine protease Do